MRFDTSVARREGKKNVSIDGIDRVDRPIVFKRINNFSFLEDISKSGVPHMAEPFDSYSHR